MSPTLVSSRSALFLAALALASQLMGDVDVLDALVLGQDPERGGIGGELVS
ncbi:hypothetical protein [Thiorhodovibrio winogradskyi]|uniref:hypothetical protein n=1 Tax=Thiorhodovibrio winogradskyi TaxID=77007 RepID=UPI002E2C748E|nr:hypothetical protein [Thiorhodovibrio winogradskyi]